MGEACTVQALLRAIRYEHWLRYYFAELPPEPETAGAETREDDFQRAVLRIPPEWSERSRREEPEMFSLLEALRDRPVSLDSAREAVFRHVSGELCSAGEPGDELFHLVGDPDFRRGLDSFHGWVQRLANGELRPAGPETGDEDAPVPFSSWEQSYAAWEREQGRHHITQIRRMRG